MALWTGAILLALGLVWFAGAVAVPFLHTDAVLRDYGKVLQDNPPPAAYAALPFARRQAVEHLGGPDEATRQLSSYLKMPGCLAIRKKYAANLLPECGRKAALALAGAMEDSDVVVRTAAATGLQSLGPEGVRALPALIRALHDPDIIVRREAARALGGMSPLASAAVSSLQGLLTDKDPSVRAAAAEALKKIRGEEAGK
jgi:HEAT repeat protein